MSKTTTMTVEQENAQLRAEIEALKAKALVKAKITLKVSEKKALSAYGLGRWPVTLYREQWLRLLAEAEQIKAFITANTAELATKEA